MASERTTRSSMRRRLHDESSDYHSSIIPPKQPYIPETLLTPPPTQSSYGIINLETRRPRRWRGKRMMMEDHLDQPPPMPRRSLIRYGDEVAHPSAYSELDQCSSISGAHHMTTYNVLSELEFDLTLLPAAEGLNSDNDPYLADNEKNHHQDSPTHISPPQSYDLPSMQPPRPETPSPRPETPGLSSPLMPIDSVMDVDHDTSSLMGVTSLAHDGPPATPLCPSRVGNLSSSSPSAITSLLHLSPALRTTPSASATPPRNILASDDDDDDEDVANNEINTSNYINDIESPTPPDPPQSRSESNVDVNVDTSSTVSSQASRDSVIQFISGGNIAKEKPKVTFTCYKKDDIYYSGSQAGTAQSALCFGHVPIGHTPGEVTQAPVRLAHSHAPELFPQPLVAMTGTILQSPSQSIMTHVSTPIQLLNPANEGLVLEEYVPEVVSHVEVVTSEDVEQPTEVQVPLQVGFVEGELEYYEQVPEVIASHVEVCTIDEGVFEAPQPQVDNSVIVANSQVGLLMETEYKTPEVISVVIEPPGDVNVIDHSKTKERKVKKPPKKRAFYAPVEEPEFPVVPVVESTETVVHPPKEKIYAPPPEKVRKFVEEETVRKTVEKSVEEEKEKSVDEEKVRKSAEKSVEEEKSLHEEAVKKSAEKSVEEEKSVDEEAVKKSAEKSVEKEKSVDEEAVKKSAEKSVEKEKSVDEEAVKKSAEKSVEEEKSVDEEAMRKSAEKLADKKVRKSVEKFVDKKVRKSVEKPVEKKVKKCVEKPVEKKVRKPAEKSAEEKTRKYAEKLVREEITRKFKEKSIEEKVRKLAEKSVEEEKSVDEDKVRKLAQKSVEEKTRKSAEKLVREEITRKFKEKSLEEKVRKLAEKSVEEEKSVDEDKVRKLAQKSVEEKTRKSAEKLVREEITRKFKEKSIEEKVRTLAEKSVDKNKLRKPAEKSVEKNQLRKPAEKSVEEEKKKSVDEEKVRKNAEKSIEEEKSVDEEKVRKPEEKSVEEKGKKSVEKSLEEETLVDEEKVRKPAEKSVKEKVIKPAEKLVEEKVRKPAEKLVEEEKSVDEEKVRKHAEKLVDEKVKKSVEKPIEKTRKSVEKTVEKTGKSAEEPVEIGRISLLKPVEKTRNSAGKSVEVKKVKQSAKSCVDEEEWTKRAEKLVSEEITRKFKEKSVEEKVRKSAEKRVEEEKAIDMASILMPPPPPPPPRPRVRTRSSTLSERTSGDGVSSINASSSNEGTKSLSTHEDRFKINGDGWQMLLKYYGISEAGETRQTTPVVASTGSSTSENIHMKPILQGIKKKHKHFKHYKRRPFTYEENSPKFTYLPKELRKVETLEKLQSPKKSARSPKKDKQDEACPVTSTTPPITATSNKSYIQDGNIISFTLTNFMAYRNRTWYFDQGVTFIHGQNGSGKSAIQLGIRFLLGEKAANTLRSNAIKNFIKTGYTYAETEGHFTNYNGTLDREQYGDILKLRRRIKHTGQSIYTACDRQGKWNQIKQHDLAFITHSLSLDPNNPFQFLPQNRFKDSSKPGSSQQASKDFTKFCDATKLTEIDEMLKTSRDNLKVVKAKIGEKVEDRGVFAVMEKQFGETLAQIQRLEKDTNRLPKMKIELAWAKVKMKEDDQKQIQQAKIKVASEETELKQLKKKLEEDVTNFSSVEQKKKQILQDVLRQVQKLEQEREQKHKELREFSRTQKRAQSQHTTITKNIREYNEEIAKLEREMNRESISYEKENARHQAEIQKCEEKIQEKEDLIIKLRGQRDALASNINEYKGMRQKELGRIKSLDAQLRETNREMKKDLYGAKMQDLLQQIDQIDRKKGWIQKPIGPLGKYVTVPDDKYAPLVEHTLFSALFTVAVFHTSDLYKLKGIIKDVIANCEKRRGGHKPRDPEAILVIDPDDEYVAKLNKIKRKLSGLKTVRSMIEIKGDLAVEVEAALVEKTKCERTLIFDNNQEAATIMKNPPFDEILAGYTLEWFRVNPMPRYQFHPLPGRRVKTEIIPMGKDMEEMTKEIKAEIAEAKEVINTCNINLKAKNGLEDQLARTDDEMQAAKKEITRLGNKIKYEQSCLRKEPKENIDKTMVDQIKLIQEMRAKREAEIKVPLTELELTNAEITRIRAEIEQIDAQLPDLKKKQDELEGDHSGTNRTVAKLSKEIDDLNGKIKRLGKELLALGEQENKVLDELEEYQAAAKIAGERPKVLNRPPQEVAVELEQLQTIIAANKDKLKRKARVVAEYNNAKELVTQITKEIDSMNKLIEKFEQLIKVNTDHYEKMKKELGNQLKSNYRTLVEAHGLTGDLLIDWDNESLMYYVSPDKSADCRAKENYCQKDGEEIIVDKKKWFNYVLGLSGGERSKATVFFVMAVWKITDMPLCVLDEFEACFDDLSRGSVHSTIINHARKHPESQFFILTPLDPNIRDDEKEFVKIIYIKKSDQMDPDASNKTPTDI